MFPAKFRPELLPHGLIPILLNEKSIISSTFSVGTVGTFVLCKETHCTAIFLYHAHSKTDSGSGSEINYREEKLNSKKTNVDFLTQWFSYFFINIRQLVGQDTELDSCGGWHPVELRTGHTSLFNQEERLKRVHSKCTEWRKPDNIPRHRSG